MAVVVGVDLHADTQLLEIAVTASVMGLLFRGGEGGRKHAGFLGPVRLMRDVPLGTVSDLVL